MKLLILSNFDEKSKLEDLFIAGAFEKDGHEVAITTVHYSETLEDIYDIIIRRNTWFEEETEIVDYHNLIYNITERLKRKNKLRINFNGHYDTTDKNYLVELYQNNYEVIPSIRPDMDLSILPISEMYLLKPLDSYNGYGQKKIRKEEITIDMINQYIIQPFIESKSEIQFYFVNHKLEYAKQYIPNKLAENGIIKDYLYSEQEAMLATKFAKLNQNFNGVQRIDFIQDTHDNLLLLEIEDAAPYLSLEYISEQVREQFLNDYKNMVYKAYQKNSTKC